MFIYAGAAIVSRSSYSRSHTMKIVHRTCNQNLIAGVSLLYRNARASPDFISPRGMLSLEISLWVPHCHLWVSNGNVLLMYTMLPISRKEHWSYPIHFIAIPTTLLYRSLYLSLVFLSFSGTEHARTEPLLLNSVVYIPMNLQRKTWNVWNIGKHYRSILGRAGDVPSTRAHSSSTTC